MECHKLLSAFLHKVLLDLHQWPCPHVPNPPNCKKRASVALIIRVRPAYQHWPAADESAAQNSDHSLPVCQRIDAFFSLPWVQMGEPEVLFIKRASRVGDRWTGHVALPGGKRDPEDTDDKETAIRETAEEIGLDLKTDDCIHVGKLPERVVTTSWGTVPLMVLCPFVFLTTRSDSPMLRLQPTEVASTHWVPLRGLLSPSSRTIERADVAERFSKQTRFIPRFAYRLLLGSMQFSAIRLMPTESLFCNPDSRYDNIDEWPPQNLSFSQRCQEVCSYPLQADFSDRSNPLLLWGLTLGILADFLDMLPPHSAVKLWKYPTFTTPDLRLIVTILTCRLRKRNMLLARHARHMNETAADNTSEALPVTLQGKHDSTGYSHNEVGIGGLGVGRYYRSPDSNENSVNGTSYAVGIMLMGYYDRLRVAVWIFLAWRFATSSAGVYCIWNFLRRRGLSFMTRTRG